MRTRAYREVDVFADAAYGGNPLAVVTDCAGLDTERMQLFARWTNLSETSFLVAPTDPAADYRVRIFTPRRELPFAGHPTLGSCHAWLSAGGAPRQVDEVVQECGVGLVRLRREGTRIAFAAPSLQRTQIEARLLESVLAALDLPRERLQAAQLLVNGPHWLGLLVDSAATVLALEPDHEALRSLGLVGVIGPWRDGAGAQGTPGARCDYEVRAFAAADGIPEDPVTGSLNAALAQWLIAEALAPARYLVAQGTRLQRQGRVHIEAAGGQVWVGGNCSTCVEGSVQL